ncbi:MAG TPA: hypothetical protein VGG80_07700 [Acidobacteriaceae bacterium]|jgi:hypothetical protein
MPNNGDSITDALSELQKSAMATVEHAYRGLNTTYDIPALRNIERNIQRAAPFWEIQAKEFMDAIRERVTGHQRNLAENQELLILSGTGENELEIEFMYMQGSNAVCMIGKDRNGKHVECISHMSSVSLRLITQEVIPPLQPKRIGF